MNTSQRLMAGAAAVALMLLAGCGDSGDDVAAPTAAPNAVPAAATASPNAYTQYAASLPVSETGAPLDVNAVEPPTSETAAPLAI